ncbi:site-specific integrase [Nocardia abscessus]|uniref:tyrosine-type recombinase/integrase n=1 Tax=Nocardia abscessus TaxID=120957 RepID=UPI001893B9D6|nr:site-specific integrase [Nocardia abscessus]MBF6221754.1 site-specific integrase [Nocardia abscessus]
MKRAEVDIALRFMASLGLTAGDLTSAQAGGTSMPTIGEYIQWMAIKAPKGTNHYRYYLSIIEKEWGQRPLDSLSEAEIEELAARHRRRAIARANSRGGHGAHANVISALRFLYHAAVNEGLIEPEANTAAEVVKATQPSRPARVLSVEQIGDLGRVASTTGDDTELDALILRLHIETACRRNAVLALRIEDLDRDDCLARLHEHDGAIRWQPISPTLMNHLLSHIRCRGGRNTTDHVLRYQRGTPVDIARYQYLVRRFRCELAWADALQVNMDWIHHTTQAFVEKQFGHRTADLFKHGPAHIDNHEHHDHYDPRRLASVAEVLVALTGEPHPLARR